MPKRSSAPSSLAPAKKPKLTAVKNQPPLSGKPKKSKGYEKSSAKASISIPFQDNEDVELSDGDLGFLEEFGDAASFLQQLDRTGITRSKQETERLYRLEKPIRTTSKLDEISVELSDEDSNNSDLNSSAELSVNEPQTLNFPDSDTEMPYERVLRTSPQEPQRQQVIQRLPIKLADGRLLKTGFKSLSMPSDSLGHNDDETQEFRRENIIKIEDVSTGKRFGRPAVWQIVGQKSRKLRIEHAKEQIAGICQEIVADPENSLGLLRRLHTFSSKAISSPSQPDPVPNDPLIRKLALLSQLAVFKDIIPGYRIRALTEKEAAEKVGQMVAHLREWEQGLVIVYQNYLRYLETELKTKSDLAETALKCMCTLLTDVTHFNFRVNLMACIIAQLSRKSWNKTCDMCLNALISVFRADSTGVASLEIVQILNRMVKERRFGIHPNVLSCLHHLRLKSELNVRASESKADKPSHAGSLSKQRMAARRAKGKIADQPHLSKKAQKALKERKEIEKEFREAEAVIDQEERATVQTETLKLLFGLYFRILKNSTPTPLLPAALHGISKFAHLVNVDFFKDLMAVLKSLVAFASEEGGVTKGVTCTEHLHLRLLCVVTAFELLSGQGEALNIDLNDFVTQLYALVLPLSLIPDIDSPSPGMNGSHRRHKSPTTADLLFRALHVVFSPRSSGTAAPSWRSAAFGKRLLTACLNWPPTVTVRVLDFVGGLISKDSKVEALLSTEDRVYAGIYRPEVDDPQLCHPFGTCFWELLALRNHSDTRVQEKAHELTQFTRA
ncbi:hypothetical protein AX17_003510 [Amanita inopinata Kibby_2008]|nr:hypothetical protein AX17_003510 [Amanita inopinata Kibby_2008]